MIQNQSKDIEAVHWQLWKWTGHLLICLWPILSSSSTFSLFRWLRVRISLAPQLLVPSSQVLIILSSSEVHISQYSEESTVPTPCSQRSMWSSPTAGTAEESAASLANLLLPPRTTRSGIETEMLCSQIKKLIIATQVLIIWAIP